MLTLQDVYAGYGGGDVLRGLDLSVVPGSVTCVLGPNGAGKSTFLRVVSGLIRLRDGAVLLGDERIDQLSAPQVLAKGIAQVPQTGALFSRMSVRDNILMGGYLIRRQRALLAERYSAVAELVPLVAERPAVLAGNLSGGQRRLVEIGRSLMLDPSVVLLDEPSLGLDPAGVGAVAGLVGGMRDRGKTVVLVEQNVRLGLSLSTHAIVLDGGRVRLQGSASDISVSSLRFGFS
ncbi:ABC transporter ATP-binding protein [Kibdelosporangium phytohabitans]|uniref:Branched-chain amino acid ABC transporter ATP-binding protein n=1 Tax=Kibdelosporangium phytohabitans TaxID=860235 RepID=A0A0N7F4L7_9PSEU|nr:ATP-binding cassette domain-containing protein [Kibdelosporangium phytohabitans]ALG11783.1 branched-chain amino acid ABC transporter ATP-binding protein [Kibdelosporangium phytohabitans]MBE1463191.1 branched-chain amino acid transport system ATP-binding protein [Kibdelosporangium phytohabitans]